MLEFSFGKEKNQGLLFRKGDGKYCNEGLSGHNTPGLFEYFPVSYHGVSSILLPDRGL